MKNIILVTAAVFAAGLAMSRSAEIGHFDGGILNIRDYVLADPGLYLIFYNYYYLTDRLNDRNGDKISSLTVNTPGGPVPVGVNVNVHTYALLPTLVWSTPCTFLGARYGGYIAPEFSKTSLEADLSIANNAGGTINNSTFGVGDLYVQPIWLDWSPAHWDFALAYGFFAPVGKYNTQTVALTGGGNVKVESADNVGLGYWTQQAQAGVAWYPMTNKATAMIVNGTYNYNGEKSGLDLRLGQMFTLNWGINQYFPLCKSQALLLEAGPVGYDSWQITDSTGSDPLADTPRSRVHAAGGELGLTYVPWKVFLKFHGFYQYSARSRFQGTSLGLNVGIKF